MKWKIKLSLLAKQDIQNVLQYTFEEFGETQHDHYDQMIKQSLFHIGLDPTQFPAKQRPELKEGWFSFHISRKSQKARHQFIYRISDEGIIYVSRFLYDGMDIARHLPSTDPKA